MKYYYLNVNSIPNFDDQTNYINFQAQNYGLEFSCFSLDDFITKDDHYFCTERLFLNLFKKKTSFSNYCTGVEFANLVRTTKNANWLENFPDANIEKFFEIFIVGSAFEDDLGILNIELQHEIVGKYIAKLLIVSERACKLLLTNHCPYLTGFAITSNEISYINKKLDEIINNQNAFLLLKTFKGDIF